MRLLTDEELVQVAGGDTVDFNEVAPVIVTAIGGEAGAVYGGAIGVSVGAELVEVGLVGAGVGSALGPVGAVAGAAVGAAIFYIAYRNATRH